MSAGMVGCATTANKDANKNLFEQALVLQKVNTGAHSNNQKSKIQWQFTPLQFEPNKQQKFDLFVWLSKMDNYSNNPILLQLGPDWISSYKRGNNLRKMIPRGIVIEQQYDADLPSHQVVFSLKPGGRNEYSSQ